MKDVQDESLTLKLALDTDNISILRQLHRHLGTFTFGTWDNAQHDMEIVSTFHLCVQTLTEYSFRLPVRSRPFCLRIPSLYLGSGKEKQ